MTYEQFTHYAQSYNVVPVSSTLFADRLTPVSAYLRLRAEGTSAFLFESVEGGERYARYSFIGRNPLLTLKCKGNQTTIEDQAASITTEENFFDLIERTIKQYRQAPLEHLPRFAGGLVGFIGYDAIRFVENIPDSTRDALQTFDSILSLFTSIVVFDHFTHRIRIIVNVIIDETAPLEEKYHQAVAKLDYLESLLKQRDAEPAAFACAVDALEAEISQPQFESMVLQAKQHIHEGDIFQVVLSQRCSVPYHGDTFNVYRALRVVNPSPYLYFLEMDGFTVIGSSPEILVRMEGSRAEVYPIAGTRPRGNNDEHDSQLENELLADTKERAEHVMLIDLARNDLGRVCEVGTVRVDRLMDVVRYSHVMHMATRVVGDLPNSATCVDVLKATFPAGTVSGAPKIRAMEIIDELERTRRGMYAGGVGYIDFSGNMDMCIAIRTMFAHGGRMYFQAGAGIVADSHPEKEYQETINKARALVEALRMASTLHQPGGPRS
ncbi:MAG: anthranilate synthase component I [Acidobacteria bacterium]|nr:anthranilate synthase component I [Acidobacteriota bacterium]